MQLIKKISIIAVLIFSAAAQAEIINITNDKTENLLKEGIPLIDIRTVSEWKETGVVEGSHLLTLFDEKGNFDINKWTAELNKIAGKDKPFMVICAVGGRTAMLTQYLDGRMGYTQVHNVQRGIDSWIHAGKPVVDYKPDAASKASSEEATSK